MTDGVIIAVVVQISGIIGMFGKSWLDKRIATREITNREQLHSKALKEVQDVMVRQGMDIKEIKDIVLSHVSKDAFIIQFSNDMLKESNSIVNIAAAYNLPIAYQNIILEWAQTIEKFGLLFYKSEERKKGGMELNDFLQGEYKKLKKKFDNYTSYEVKEAKSYLNKKIQFVAFLDGFGIFKGMNFIINKLVKNGLTHEDIIDMFCVYLSEWNKLPEYECIDKFD